MGGHDIPHKDIVRRYKRSLENLPQYCRMADEFYLFDASTTPVRLIVARTDAEETVHDPEALKHIQSRSRNGFPTTNPTLTGSTVPGIHPMPIHMATTKAKHAKHPKSRRILVHEYP